MIQARTDRNNNPAAITTDIAREAGLIYGKDYINGDPFHDGTRQLYTAKLLTDDPAGMIVKVIDAIGYYTHGGSLRWVYIGIPTEIWKTLTDGQKRAAVAYHYRREGGTALLSRILTPPQNPPPPATA